MGAAARVEERSTPWEDRPPCPTPGCEWRLDDAGRCLPCDRRANRELTKQMRGEQWAASHHSTWSGKEFKGPLLNAYLSLVLGVVGGDRTQRGWEKLVLAVVNRLELGGRRTVTEPGEAVALWTEYLKRPASTGGERGA